VVGIETAATTVVNNNITDALETLSITQGTAFTDEAARDFINLMLRPSNQNLVELYLRSALGPVFFGALVGKPSSKESIFLKGATNIDALIVDIDEDDSTTKLTELALALPKMKHLLELQLFCSVSDYGAIDAWNSQKNQSVRLYMLWSITPT